MKNKLAKKREQGYHGWETCKHGDLVQLLINHVDEGGPIDVANFCAFLSAVALYPPPEVGGFTATADKRKGIMQKWADYLDELRKENLQETM